MTKQVIVLGMHRSGTSMVAGVLHKLGVHMGDRMLGADWTNASGHYEDVAFLRINKALLHYAGGNWQHPPSEAGIGTVHDLDECMIQLVMDRDAQHSLWGWKDPRTALTIGKWAPLLGDPFYVAIARDMNAVCLSLRKRNGMDVARAARLSREYERRIDAFLMGQEDRTVRVWYERMLAEPELHVQQIAASIGVPPTVEAIAHIDACLNHA